MNREESIRIQRWNSWTSIEQKSLLRPAIHSFFYWRILKKTVLFSGFKNPYEEIRETRKLESIYE
jgi:hypothetical protein